MTTFATATDGVKFAYDIVGDADKRKQDYIDLQKKMLDVGPYIIMFQSISQRADRATMHPPKATCGLELLDVAANRVDRTGKAQRR